MPRKSSIISLTCLPAHRRQGANSRKYVNFFDWILTFQERLLWKKSPDKTDNLKEKTNNPPEGWRQGNETFDTNREDFCHISQHDFLQIAKTFVPNRYDFCTNSLWLKSAKI